ncbi:unnamed protein product [Meloidogyne enterolobii]|uniref:Uncharacterized protein n=1 Tax=Meloidogyne enterolobii TaxID=390850 RepID=A0ACB1AUZ4_MELEN
MNYTSKTYALKTFEVFNSPLITPDPSISPYLLVPQIPPIFVSDNSFQKL